MWRATSKNSTTASRSSMTSVTSNPLFRWLTAWTHKPTAAVASPYPLGVSEPEVTALRRVYTVVDDVLVAATQLKDHTDARTHATARADQRAASTFVNTPWYDAAFARA